MTGPRSKGCEACREQKKKCDQAKPACARCVRLKIKCLGVEMKFIVQTGPRTKPTRFRNLTASHYKGNLEQSDHRLPGFSPLQTKPSFRLKKVDAKSLLLSSRALAPPITIQPKWHTLGPRQAQYFDRFQNHVAPQLGSFSFDEFWSRAILRESFRDDCILEAILGLGALSQALDSASGEIPLFKVQVLDAPRGYYAEAIGYYTKSLARLRQRIAAGDSSTASRTVLISSILFSAFELLQGDSGSADQVLNHSVAMLKDSILSSSWPGKQSRIAAAYDDEGVEDAEYTLMRRLAFRTLLSPMQTEIQGGELISACTFPWLMGPGPPAQSEGFDVFWKLWMRFLTLILMWHIRNDRLVRSYGYAAVSEKTFSWEREILLNQINIWIDATQEKLSNEQSMDGAAVLRKLYAGLKAIHFMAYTSFSDSDQLEAEVHEDLVVIFNTAEAILAETPLFQAGLGEVYDGIQSISLGPLARLSRNRAIRTKAISLAKKLVNEHSRWDAKAILMATCALVELEEEGRDDTGSIPLARRYDWTYLSWNEDYSNLCVVFEARGLIGGVRDKKTMNLDPEKYGLVGRTALPGSEDSLKP